MLLLPFPFSNPLDVLTIVSRFLIYKLYTSIKLESRFTPKIGAGIFTSSQPHQFLLLGLPPPPIPNPMQVQLCLSSVNYPVPSSPQLHPAHLRVLGCWLAEQNPQQQPMIPPQFSPLFHRLFSSRQLFRLFGIFFFSSLRQNPFY